MYERRIKIFMLVILLGGLVLAARLVDLQIVNGREYRRRAEEYLQYTELTRAQRGQIMDRRGRILAVDRPCFDLCLDFGLLDGDPDWNRRQIRRIAAREDVDSEEAERIFTGRLEQTWRRVRRVAEREEVDLDETVADILERVERIRRRVGMDIREQRQAHPVVEGLGEAEALALDAALADGVGVVVRPGHKRWYPYGPQACHILGVTGPVTSKEMAELNPDAGDRLERLRTRYRADEIIGKSGVEKMCELILRGKRGYRRMKKTGELLEEVAPTPGGDVHLTLDIYLQEALTELLTSRGKNGCIVVLSVETGDVLAMVSVPMYDLNRYRKDFRLLVADEVDLPLLHRAIQRRYPPGSTVKVVTALAGLGAGAITPGSVYHCSGRLIPSKPHMFRCWKRSGHGDLALEDAIQRSCNIYFYKTGDRVGIEGLVYWFSQFGFGRRPGTGLPEEKAGTLPTPEYVRARYDRAIVPADAWMTSIGQGAITATPLQVANEMATIARGGVFLSPLLALEGAPARQRRELEVSDAHIAAVHKGMHAVCNRPGGTAYRYFRSSAGPTLGFDVCGKTGTAQTAPQRIDSNDNGRIDRRDRIVREGDTGWFAGFAPYERPKVAVAVMTEYIEGGGGRNCAPIAREVFAVCKRFGYVP